MHKLCSILNELGHSASIWHNHRPHYSEVLSINGFKKSVRYILNAGFYKKSDISPYHLNIAKISDIKNAVVVYPEITDGNPLDAQRVVRWLLNKPGAINGKVNFGDKELIFYFSEHFDDPHLTSNQSHQLHVLDIQKHIYQKNNYGERSGMCYLIRKGAGRILNQHEEGSVKIDGLSHREIAAIFNRTKYFVSYDLYTGYSRYAAMCGCIPVVIPDSKISKEKWRPEIENRYGIAYGWNDLDWAISTRDDLLNYLEGAEQRSRESVSGFVNVCSSYFNGLVADKNS